MMRESTMDYSVLGWVSGELDVTLGQAAEALEEYADQGGDETRLQFCVTHLHQVLGILRMLELEGAVLLAEEQEAVAQALLDGSIDDRDTASEALMRAILRLRRHLERLHGGQDDAPALLLPLINELRGARGADRLAESTLFAPDLSRADQRVDAPVRDGNDRRADVAPKARAAYQRGLLGFLRGSPSEGLARMVAALDQMDAASPDERRAAPWWVGAALVDAVRAGSLAEASDELRPLIARLEREMKRVADLGPEADVPVDVLRNLLYYVSAADTASDRIEPVQTAFGLNELRDAQSRLEAEAADGGPDAEALRTVAAVLREDVASIKDGLDLHVRAGADDPARLREAAEGMRRVADTLAVLGLESPRRTLLDHAELLEDGTADEATVMQGAEALLYIESELDRYARGESSESDGQEHSVFDSEYEAVSARVIEEAIAEMGHVREAIVRTLESDGSAPDPEIARRFETVEGALRVLGNDRVSALLHQAARATDALMSPGQRVDETALDDLADAITSLEYYLEALRDGRREAERILDVADSVLSRLVPPEEPVAEPPAAEEAGAVEPEGHDDGDAGTATEPAPAEASPEAVADAPAAGRTPDPAQPSGIDFARKRGRVDTEVAVRADEVDPEILEVFVEEVDEVLATLREAFPQWRTDADDREALLTTRRMFHTLKGSGRLAGALLLGELAWSVENLLNRVLDGSREADAEVHAIVAEAIELMPPLTQAMTDGGDGPVSEARSLMERAIAAADPDAGAVRAGADAEAPAAGSVEDTADTLSAGEAPDSVSTPEAGDDVAATAAPGVSVDEGEREQPPLDVVPEGDADLATEPDDAAQDDAAGPAMEPTLYEIFRKETEDHLAEIPGYLYVDETGAHVPCHPNEGLIRTLHTLTGSARMANVEPVAELGRALENLARARQSESTLLDATDQALIERGRDAIRQILDALAVAGTPLPETDALVAEAQARGRVRPGPSLEELSDRARIAPAGYAVARGESRATAMPTLTLPDSGMPTGYPAGRGEGRAAAMPVLDDETAPVAETSAEPSPEDAAAEEVVADVAAPVPDGDEVRAADPEPEPESGPAEPDASDEYDEPEPSSTPAATEPVSASTPDPELAEIFLEEAQDILRFLEGTLDRWEESAEPEMQVAELHRSLHTLKGGARLAGFQGIGRFCHSVEGLVAEVGAGRIAADDRFFDLMHSALDELVDLVERAGHGEQPEADADLGARLATMAHGDEEPAAPDDEDERELREVFLEESSDILAENERILQDWREQPESNEPAEALQRALHTLKGGARMTGLTPVANLAHGLETLLQGVAEREGGAGESLFELLEACNDRLIQQREEVAAGQAPSDAEDLLAAIAEHGEQAPAAATPPEQAESGGSRADATATESSARSAPSAGTRGDVVRVAAESLDNLVNHAGEVSIYRARLEQQAGAVDFNLAELDQTVTRLREQLRTMEIETEAQILHGFGHDDVSQRDRQEEFDPLELDRFSRMQELSRALSESVNDLSSIQSTLQTLNRETETLLLQQARVNTDLQDGLMRTRMVPFANLVPRMRRIVRQASHELGRQVQLQVGGAEGEMDRTVLERIVPPLEHMLRNAVAHGIETPANREASGKPKTGTIRIDVSREGADVVLRVGDDGVGMNLVAIRDRALDRGLMKPDAVLTDREIVQFVLEPGFSTASQVTQIAGRGVGMDVVNAEIKQLGGSLEIDSTYGEGTCFTVRLPFTLALNQALLCQAADEAYAIPLSSIEGVVRAEHGFLRRALQSREQAYYEYAGERYELLSLASLLGAGDVHTPDDRALAPLILVQAGEHRVALHVDGLIGSRDIVVKSLGPQISGIPGIFGATILADGRVVLILDVGALMRYRGRELEGAAAQHSDAERRERALVMVVDDSITMRKVATRLLERNGMDVITAKDGVDAVTRLQEGVPDAVLLDIEMPRMDGYEFAAHMRNEPALREVPIVMITSRTGEKHRQRAMDIGVDRYLGKPYQEGELLQALQELLEAGRVSA